jgi:hypothetical protein
MLYSDIRPKIKTGDALFFSGGNWRSIYGIQVMLVRMFKPSKWSHVGMAWVANDRVFIMESVGTGIRLFPLSREIPFGWVPKPEQLSQTALEWAFAHIGVKYPPKWKMALNKAFGMHVDLDGHMDCSDFFTGILAQDRIYFNCAADPTTLCDEVTDHWGGLELITT